MVPQSVVTMYPQRKARVKVTDKRTKSIRRHRGALHQQKRSHQELLRFGAKATDGGVIRIGAQSHRIEGLHHDREQPRAVPHRGLLPDEHAELRCTAADAGHARLRDDQQHGQCRPPGSFSSRSSFCSEMGRQESGFRANATISFRHLRNGRTKWHVPKERLRFVSLDPMAKSVQSFVLACGLTQLQKLGNDGGSEKRKSTTHGRDEVAPGLQAMEFC
jgi:hypothetical protein